MMVVHKVRPILLNMEGSRGDFEVTRHGGCAGTRTIQAISWFEKQRRGSMLNIIEETGTSFPLGIGDNF